MPPAAQPRMTHACSSPGWMVQNLINYSSIGATALRKHGSIRGHRAPDLEPFPLPLGPQIDAPACTGVPNSSFDRHPSIQASKHPCFRSQRSAAEAVACKSGAPRQEVAGRAGHVIRFLSKLGGEASPSLRWLRLCRRPLPLTTRGRSQASHFCEFGKVY